MKFIMYAIALFTALFAVYFYAKSDSIESNSSNDDLKILNYTAYSIMMACMTIIVLTIASI